MGKRKPVIEGIPRACPGDAERSSAPEAPSLAAEIAKLNRDDLMRASCVFWASEVLSGPKEPPYNGRFLAADVHIEWSDMLNHKNVAIMAPRDSGKSYFFSLAYPLWRAFHEPGKEGYIFSASQRLAERILGQIKREVETNPLLQHLMPKDGDVKAWSAKSIEFSNGHRLHSYGSGTRVRGAHPQYVLCDDIMDDKCSHSEVARTRIDDWLMTSVVGMLHDSGQLVVVGTPFHAEDIFGKLEDNTRFIFKKYPAIDPETEEALIPDRYSLPQLEAKREMIGGARFSREYLVSPTSAANSPFPKNLTLSADVCDPTYRLGEDVQKWDQAGVRRFIGVDLAISANAGSDYFIVWCGGVGPDAAGRKHYIIDIDRKRRIGFTEQLQSVVEMAQKYAPIELIFIESNQYQQAFTQELINRTDLPVQKFHTTGAKHHEVTGLPGLRLLFENHKIRVPRPNTQALRKKLAAAEDPEAIASLEKELGEVERTRKLIDEWANELESFEFVQGKMKSVGKHDDMAMAFYICTQATKQNTFSFSFMDTSVTRDEHEEIRKEIEAEQKVAQEDVKHFRKAGNNQTRNVPSLEDIMGRYASEYDLQ